MKITDEFKKALIEMPAKEKDKLILRLLKKDVALTKRLYFELVQPASMEELREDVLQNLLKQID